MRNGIIALALIFSLMLASMPAAISATTDEDSCSGGTCGADYDVTLTELEGAERNNAIADALKDGEVKKLLLELVKTGYMPGMDDAMAFTEEDSGAIAVVIPFEQKDTGEPAEIAWIYNPETGTVMVMLAHDWWCEIPIGIACAIGCAAVCAIATVYSYGTLTLPCVWGCEYICIVVVKSICG